MPEDNTTTLSAQVAELRGTVLAHLENQSKRITELAGQVDTRISDVRTDLRQNTEESRDNFRQVNAALERIANQQTDHEQRLRNLEKREDSENRLERAKEHEARSDKRSQWAIGMGSIAVIASLVEYVLSSLRHK